jgi:uncharacterized membrane protein
MGNEFGRAAAATALYGLSHSVLAAPAVKRAVRRRIGDRAYHGLYRLLYNAVAAGGLALVLREVVRRPGPTLYEVRGPAAGLLRAAQGGCLLYLGWGVRHAGFGHISGLANAFRYLAGGPVVPLAEGQGPAPEELHAHAEGGPFRHTRNPLNAGFAALPLLNPRMTAAGAGFALVCLGYAVVGSYLSERRLRRAYGRDFERYRRRGAGFFVPRVRAGVVG